MLKTKIVLVVIIKLTMRKKHTVKRVLNYTWIDIPFELDRSETCIL